MEGWRKEKADRASSTRRHEIVISTVMVHLAETWHHGEYQVIGFTLNILMMVVGWWEGGCCRGHILSMTAELCAVKRNAAVYKDSNLVLEIRSVHLIQIITLHHYSPFCCWKIVPHSFVPC